MKYYFEESGELVLNEKKKCIDITQSKPVFENADFVMALSMVLCGFVYCNVIETYSLGLGIFMFTLILCSVTLCYFRTKGLKQTKVSTVWLGIIGVAALQFILFDGSFIKNLNLIFISLSFIYWVAVSVGNVTGTKLSIYSLWDFFNQTFIVPFSNFTCEYLGLKYGLSKNKHSKNAKYMLLGLIIFLPLMFFVVGQLSSADVVFETLLHRFWDFISVGTLLTYAVQFGMGIPVACYLFGLIYGNTVKANIGSVSVEKLDHCANEVRFAPKITVYTVLTAFNLIYLVFFVSQMAYFLSAFQSILPDNLTYAEYARSGFFELCRVSFVNMVLIALAHVFITKEETKDKKEQGQEEKGERVELKKGSPTMLRIQTGLLSMMTIGLIVTALSKMYMYIESYGLTQLRVYTSCFMVMLLFAFFIILLRQIKTFQASRIIMTGCIIGFLLFSYSNVDGNIAKYNIEGYEAGRLEKIDYNMLIGLSDGAVPYLYELYKNTDDMESKHILYWRMAHGNKGDLVIPYEDRRLKSFNLQSERAATISGLLQSEGFPDM